MAGTWGGLRSAHRGRHCTHCYLPIYKCPKHAHLNAICTGCHPVGARLTSHDDNICTSLSLCSQPLEETPSLQTCTACCQESFGGCRYLLAPSGCPTQPLAWRSLSAVVRDISLEHCVPAGQSDTVSLSPKTLHRVQACGVWRVVLQSYLHWTGCSLCCERL